MAKLCTKVSACLGWFRPHKFPTNNRIMKLSYFVYRGTVPKYLKAHNVFPTWNRARLIWKILLVGDNLNTRTLLVVSECLKDRAFHIRTVYVNSLDPNGIVWRLGKPQFLKVSRLGSWFVTKVCVGRINYLKLLCFLLYPLTVWRHIFIGCSQGGKVTFGNILCPVNNIDSRVCV